MPSTIVRAKYSSLLRHLATVRVSFRQISYFIGRVGEYCGAVHFVDQPCWITDDSLYSLSIDSQVKPLYLFFLLQTLGLDRLRKKGGQPSTSQEPIYGLNIELPDLNEQEKIAAFIASNDEFIATMSHQLEVLQTQKHALMQNLLIGQVRVHEE